MRQGRAGPRGIDRIFIYFLPFWGAGGSCLAPCSPVVKPKREEVARLARGCSAGSQSSRPGSKPSPGKRGWQHPVLPGLCVLVGPATTLKNWGLHKSQHPGQLPLGSTEPPALFCRPQALGTHSTRAQEKVSNFSSPVMTPGKGSRPCCNRCFNSYFAEERTAPGLNLEAQ